MTNTEIENLTDIAANSLGLAGIMAHNLLRFSNLAEYEPLPVIPSQNGNALIAAPGQAKPLNSNHQLTSVSPNPANQYAVFSYHLPQNGKDQWLLIKDMNGTEVLRHSLNVAIGQYVWDTRAIQVGIYFYEVRMDNKSIENGKVVVVK